MGGTHCHYLIAGENNTLEVGKYILPEGRGTLRHGDGLVAAEKDRDAASKRKRHCGMIGHHALGSRIFALAR
jgi:hypothetical protein